MVDLQDLNDRNGAAPDGLPCDRAIFTSLPSRIGEGYRFVAWSNGLRPEERQELTRRAPSHGSLSGDAGSARGLLLLHLQSTGRSAWGFVRVSGAEHTRRGGGRVWTDFLLADAADSGERGLHPDSVRAALAEQPPPKPPLGSSPLGGVAVTRREPGAPLSRDARAVAAAAAVASWLVAGRPCVIAAGAQPADVLEDALRMLPACVRGGIDACAGLRFSPARGVKTTLTDRIDQDTVRATRGQGVECVEPGKVSPSAGPLDPWIALVSRWWNGDRAADAVRLADRLGAGWPVEQVLRVAALCESIERGTDRAEALGELLASRGAA